MQTRSPNPIFHSCLPRSDFRPRQCARRDSTLRSRFARTITTIGIELMTAFGSHRTERLRRRSPRRHCLAGHKLVSARHFVAESNGEIGGH